MRPKLKVTAISDTHMCHEDLDIPGGDILIHSGDALNRGTLDEVEKFNKWLGTLPHRYKIYVPGNHDGAFQEDIDAAISLMTNAKVLIDEEIEIEGRKIYGSPWTPIFYDWWFMKNQKDISEEWDKIPSGLDVLITHGPPYDILDFNMRGDLCGCPALKDAVIQKSPKFHVFGHIHNSSGIIEMPNTTFINAAILDDWYNFHQGPKEFLI